MSTHRRIFGSSVSAVLRKTAISFLIVAAAAFAFAGQFPGTVLATAQAATGTIDIWWPTNLASVSGVQPFKAVLEGADVNSYYMFWEVGNGQYNVMPTNTQDGPHKETAVDVSGWSWEPSGNYAITFIAQNLQGQEIARKSVTIHVGATNAPVVASASAPAPAPIAVPVPAPAPAPTPVASSVSVQPQVNQAAVVQNVASVANTVSAPVPSANPSVVINAPTDGAAVNGNVVFSASLSNEPPSSYYLFWEVGSGQYNMMPTSGNEKSVTVDVSDWSWEPSGNYAITFIAQNLQGQEIARKSVTIHVGATNAPVVASASAPAPASAPVPAPVTTIATTAPAPAPVSASVQSSNGSTVLAGAKLYVDPSNLAAQAESTLIGYDPADAALIGTIASQPTAAWFGGWNADVKSDVNALVTAAANQGAVPVLVAYNIPDRDCGGYSAGGAQTADAYAQWIAQFAAGIGGRKAAVVLEPDSLALTNCLSASQLQERFAMLSNAVKALKAAGAAVYLDAGHADWVDPGTMAQNLKSADIADADGFALNVSNFYRASDNESFGAQVSSLTGGKHFVIDTGRSGNGSQGGEWCNPSGAALGAAPTTVTGNALADAFLWLKPPGESDGTCNGGPSAGTFWTGYAEQLVRNAGL